MIGSSEACLDDLENKRFETVTPVRGTQYAALFRTQLGNRNEIAIVSRFPRAHSVRLTCDDDAATSLVALLNGNVLDPENGPMFGRAAIPADGLLPLLESALVCPSDDEFEPLVLKIFELASQSSMPAGRRGIPVRMQRLKRFIEQESHKSPTLKHMAAVVGLSPFVCLRKFKAATDTTPHAYLLECRIQKARTLLAEDCASIAAVARATGFLDQAYFARVFKRSTGLTPMQYHLMRK